LYLCQGGIFVRQPEVGGLSDPRATPRGGSVPIEHRLHGALLAACTVVAASTGSRFVEAAETSLYCALSARTGGRAVEAGRADEAGSAANTTLRHCAGGFRSRLRLGRFIFQKTRGSEAAIPRVRGTIERPDARVDHRDYRQSVEARPRQMRSRRQRKTQLYTRFLRFRHRAKRV